MIDSLATLVEHFPVNPQKSGRAMREMSEADPGGFLAQAVDILRALPKGQGLDYVLTLLAKGDYLVEILWHESLLTETQAVEVASYAHRLDRQLSVRLGRRLSAASTGTSAHTVGRVLEILAATADAMLLPLLLPFANHADRRIRSKVALMIGRVNRNARWVETRLADPDDRVRANALESMWSVDTAEARALLRKSVQDPHHRVAANALLGLYRLGEPAGIKRLIEMSAHEAPALRAAAAWAMGKCRDPRFLPRLLEMADDEAPQVHRNAEKATAGIHKRLREQSEASPLRVRLIALRQYPGGRQELWVEATTSDGLTLPGLRPTAFAVVEDEHLITDYSLQESGQHQALVVGLALPRPAPGAPDLPAAALAETLRYKGRLDQWALAHYISEAERSPVAANGQPAKFHGRLFGVELANDPEDAPQVSGPAKETVDCLISASSSALRQGLGQTATRLECAAGLDLAIRSLLSVVSHRPGTKHVVVLAGTAEDCHELAGTYRALAEQARNLNTSIHAVASPTLPATAYALLQKLAHESGGRALRAPSTDVLGDTLTTLYLSLVHHYRIVCLRKDESQTPSRILVRVQSSNASGYHEIDNLEGLDRLPAKEQLAPLATS